MQSSFLLSSLFFVVEFNSNWICNSILHSSRKIWNRIASCRLHSNEIENKQQQQSKSIFSFSLRLFRAKNRFHVNNSNPTTRGTHRLTQTTNAIIHNMWDEHATNENVGNQQNIFFLLFRCCCELFIFARLNIERKAKQTESRAQVNVVDWKKFVENENRQWRSTDRYTTTVDSDMYVVYVAYVSYAIDSLEHCMKYAFICAWPIVWLKPCNVSLSSFDIKMMWRCAGGDIHNDCLCWLTLTRWIARLMKTHTHTHNRWTHEFDNPFWPVVGSSAVVDVDTLVVCRNGMRLHSLSTEVRHVCRFYLINMTVVVVSPCSPFNTIRNIRSTCARPDISRRWMETQVKRICGNAIGIHEHHQC